MSDYLPYTAGGRWAISRLPGNEWTAVIQDSPLYQEDDAGEILSALNIDENQVSLELYFPVLKEKGRCPTLELLELFANLGARTGSLIGV